MGEHLNSGFSIDESLISASAVLQCRVNSGSTRHARTLLMLNGPSGPQSQPMISTRIAEDAQHLTLSSA